MVGRLDTQNNDTLYSSTEYAFCKEALLKGLAQYS